MVRLFVYLFVYSAVLLSVPAYVHADAEQSDAPNAAPIPPTHVAGVDSHRPVQDMLPLPEEDAAYVARLTYVIDVWRMIAYRWKEIAGVVLLIVLLFIARKLWRWWRIGRLARDLPHCPSCHYRLHDTAVDACSECGQMIDRSNIRWGQPMYKRMAFTGGLALVMVAGYVLVVPTATRYAGWYTWAQWPSQRFATFVLEHEWAWLYPNIHVGHSDIERIDLTGDTEPEPIRRLDDFSISWMTRHPADQLLIAHGYWGQRLRVLETEHFEIRLKLDNTENLFKRASTFFLSPDASSIWYVDVSGKIHAFALDQTHSLDPRDMRELTEHELNRFFSNKSNPNPGWGPYTRRAWAGTLKNHRIHGSSPNGRELKLWRLEDGELIQHIQFTRGMMLSGTTDTEASRLYAVTSNQTKPTPPAIEVWDLENGRYESVIHAPSGGPLDTITISAGGRYLFASSPTASPKCVLVRDLKTDRWVGRLDASAVDTVLSIHVMSNGRVLVDGRRGMRYKLLTYHTPQWNDAPSTQPSTQPATQPASQPAP